MKFRNFFLGMLIFFIFSTTVYISSKYIGPIIISSGNNNFIDGKYSLAAVIKSSRKNGNSVISTSTDTIIASTSTYFVEDFATNYSVKESGSLTASDSPGWWLSSGAYFKSSNGVGSTLIGPLNSFDPWRVAYSLSNSLDTDNGYYPQNIFRLVLTKILLKNYQQEVYFKVINNNLTASPNRNASNGVLFFNRYQDAFNLYYTGIRVDGAAVIKKKINGVYYTLSYNNIYNNLTPYNRDNNSNLIPLQKWIGLKSTINTNLDNTVSIKLYMDENKTGNWVLVSEAKDNNSYGGLPFLDVGYSGLRTDFMDVEFDDYKIKSI